jgi:hypothetical protein
LVVGAALAVITKLVPAVLVVPVVVLQVTDNLVPRLESSCTKIWEFTVTAVVLTVTVVAAAAIVTLPAGAAAHVPPADEQFLLDA